MSKSNKELAVDVALKVIESKHHVPYGLNNSHVTPSVGLQDICNIIKGVHMTLEELDKDSSDN